MSDALMVRALFLTVGGGGAMQCGLDFGTSNSAIAVSQDAAAGHLIPLEGDNRTMPSALFFAEADKSVSYGASAMNRYLGGEEGRLMRALKSTLGTGLIREDTVVLGRRRPFTEILMIYLSEVKRRAEASLGGKLTQLVHGRPVRFVEDDPEGDAAAEAALRDLAHAIGYKDVVFQPEPIAAATAVETGLEAGTLILIADIGGGTSDFSIVRADPKRQRVLSHDDDILAAHGLRLGGTDFDRLLNLATVQPEFGYGQAMLRDGLAPPNWLFTKLASWAEINQLYTLKTKREVASMSEEASTPRPLQRLSHVLAEELGHRLASSVEAAKIRLSETPSTPVDLTAVEAGLTVDATQEALGAAVDAGMVRLTEATHETLRRANLTGERIGALVFTGGSSLMPLVRHAIARALPMARTVDYDAFGGVAAGLARSARLVFA
ncbi:Hsp70 family protein [Lacibacterium aquatile]|uniref:Hsp70 family protein n=1 Tax=Lacibacterium aquatile TaxID=1168082 RepID=A0ABW5DPM6_9PROT